MPTRFPYLLLCALVTCTLVVGLSARPDAAAPRPIADSGPHQQVVDVPESPAVPPQVALLDSRTTSFRAFWADAFVAGFKSAADCNAMVGRAVAGNYNAIFAEVLAYHDKTGSGHGAYWNSSIVPKATDIVGGIDPLATLVQKAHAAGLEVHAWLVPYRVSATWPPSGNTTLSAHPEWLMAVYSNMGAGPSKVSGVYTLDPGSPDAQEYLLSIVRELVTNYQIDGINYDYIRYTDPMAGYPTVTSYDASSLARFQALTGYVGTPVPGDPGWCDFRRQTVGELVRRSRAEIAANTSNPRQPLRFTADLICSGDAPVSFTTSDAYAQYFQNWEYWMQQGWLDAAVPMNYKREYETNQAQWFRHWVDAAIVWRYDRHLYCGQANYLNTKADSVTQLSYAINAGSDGISNYSYFYTADQHMNDTEENDWTWYPYVAANLFTSAATRPTMPWRDPNLATEGTLWGRVTDPATGNPIDGAAVQVGTRNAVDTDGNGYYVVTLIPASAGGTTYSVTASRPGCMSVVIPGVVVRAGAVAAQDINMCNSAPDVGDMNLDGHINFADFNAFAFCMGGPGRTYATGHTCLHGDFDADRDIDLVDFSGFQRVFGTQ
jgi:uncharacterized lipoprotein YddW (UPF0748 family)